MMKCDFWKAIDAHCNDGRSGTDRRISDHVMIGQTDLTAVSMPAQKQVEFGVGGVAINLRRVRQQTGRGVGGLVSVDRLNGRVRVSMNSEMSRSNTGSAMGSNWL
jgi:hypothetical protein